MTLSKEAAKQYLRERISPRETYNDLLRFPRYLEIETVHACNARCTICTINEWTRSRKPMEERLFAKIAEELIENKKEIKRVSLYRDGEPLLDPKLPDRIALLGQAGVGDLSISTNVSLLTESRAKDILDAGVDLVIMSIDSLRKDVYESIRVGLDFEQVMENALRFIQLRERMNSHARIWMRMIVQESNQHEWPEYLAYWSPKLRETDRIYYHTLNNWGNQLKNFKPVARSYEPFLPCVALWSLLAIFTNGDASLCNVDFNGKYTVGNVSQQSISEIWRSSALNDFRDRHLVGDKAAIDICERCNVWDEPPDLESVSSRYAQADPVVPA
jgi:radical SAM protein with 4Fe4S-binding SPASM domain